MAASIEILDNSTGKLKNDLHGLSTVPIQYKFKFLKYMLRNIYFFNLSLFFLLNFRHKIVIYLKPRQLF